MARAPAQGRLGDGRGGYRLVPDRWEFWQGRKSRLHDRLHDWPLYTLTAPSQWVKARLAP